MILQPNVNIEEVGRLAAIFATDVIEIESTRDALGDVYRTLIATEGIILDNPLSPPHHLRVMNNLENAVHNLATISIRLRNIVIG